MPIETTEFKLFKKKYYAWVYAVGFDARDDAWREYCLARDLFFGGNCGIHQYGVVPAIK